MRSFGVSWTYNLATPQLLILVGISFVTFCHSFLGELAFPRHPQYSLQNKYHVIHSPLYATSKNDIPYSSIHDNILKRNGEHFKIDRFGGTIELGSTTEISTNNPKFDNESLRQWLKDDRRLALSLWDEKLMTDLGNGVYRLQLLTLNFLSFRLAPSVDALMYTDIPGEKSSSSPVFKLRSVAFDPNISLGGREFKSSRLGIEIAVIGELRISKDENGLVGRFGFQTNGKVPAPVRLVPDGALRAASALFNRQIANFAIASFQNNAVKGYDKFRMDEAFVLGARR